jgi:hypothetical protein
MMAQDQEAVAVSGSSPRLRSVGGVRVMEFCVPYRCSIYWKLDRSGPVPVVTVYSLDGLIRLNQVASSIWLLSDGRHTEEQIRTILRDRFPDVPAQRLKKDLDLFLTEAENRGLLIRCWDPLQPYLVLSERSAP